MFEYVSEDKDTKAPKTPKNPKSTKMPAARNLTVAKVSVAVYIHEIPLVITSCCSQFLEATTFAYA